MSKSRRTIHSRHKCGCRSDRCGCSEGDDEHDEFSRSKERGYRSSTSPSLLRLSVHGLASITFLYTFGLASWAYAELAASLAATADGMGGGLPISKRNEWIELPRAGNDGKTNTTCIGRSTDKRCFRVAPHRLASRSSPFFPVGTSCVRAGSEPSVVYLPNLRRFYYVCNGWEDAEAKG